MTKVEEYIVDGFEFESEQEAQKAKVEMAKINQLEKNLNYNNLDAVAMVYIKGIQKKLFGTVVGYFFLKKLQLLLQQKQYNKIDFEKYPIPVKTSEGMDEVRENETDDKEKKELKVRINHQAELKRQLKNSRLANAVMVVLVIALFIIAFTGNNPNILNYRQNIINEYSEWEQELHEREIKVKVKEQELQISE